MATEFCNDCGREFDDGNTDENIKDGGWEDHECEICHVTLCPRCARRHECSIDDLEELLGD